MDALSIADAHLKLYRVAEPRTVHVYYAPLPWMRDGAKKGTAFGAIVFDRLLAGARVWVSQMEEARG